MKNGDIRIIWRLAEYDPTVLRRYEGAGETVQGKYLEQRMKEHERFVSTAKALSKSLGDELYSEIAPLIKKKDKVFMKNLGDYKKWLEAEE